MKKMRWMLLAALCLLWPAGSLAQGLPGFEEAIEAGIGPAAIEDGAALFRPIPRMPLTDGEDVAAMTDGENEQGARAAILRGAQENGTQDEAVADGEDGAQDVAAMAESAEVKDEGELQEGALAADEGEEADGAQGDAEDDGAAADASETAAQEVALTGDDLTLELALRSDALNEGESVTLEVIVTNPRTVDTPVTLTLDVPERLGCDGDTAWETLLPAAQADETGAVTPSVTVFTRELSLGKGGVGEEVTLLAELGVGTRFYRAQAALELCVSDVRVATTAQGVEDGRVQPGQAFSYCINVRNEGTAARDVQIELVLPGGLTLAGELPEGFEQTGAGVRGTVHAQAAQAGDGALTASRVEALIPVCVDEDALEDDDDATRLLTGVLKIDGERVSMPRVQVCGPQITARLVPQADSLATGAQMDLNIVVVNTGLAPASVRVSCLLPEGLRLVEPEDEAATPGEATAVFPPEDGSSAQGAVMLTGEAEMPVVALTAENGTLIYDVYMDAAKEEGGSITANTRVITVRVQAEQPQQALREKLVGAALAYETDSGTQLAQAVAVRVYRATFMGLTGEEWGGIFWAAVLLAVTVSCLYAAVKVASDDEEKDYCFD